MTQNFSISPGEDGRKNQPIRNIFSWPYRMGKRFANQVSLVVIHIIDAGYDLVRYIRYSSSIHYSSHDRKKLEASLFFYYHKIEKALSLLVVKPLFGLGYIEKTIALVEQWVHLTGDFDAVVFRGAYSALVSYKNHVGSELQKSNPQIYEHLEQLILENARPDVDLSMGGIMSIHNDNLKTNCRTLSFGDLIKQRHSVRVFTKEHIPDEEIYDAVRLAQHTPSVCNRQCWQVHVFTSENDKAKILQHQIGNQGFGCLADRVLLISADLRCFFTSGERQQAAVDTGMFAMSLILSFEAMGIASCCLNLCLNAEKEKSLRKTALLPKWEKPIMLIVIGYPPKSLKVAVSARKSTESLLSFRDLNN